MYSVKANGNYHIIIADIGITISSTVSEDGTLTNKATLVLDEVFEGSADAKRLLESKLIIAEKVDEEKKTDKVKASKQKLEDKKDDIFVAKQKEEEKLENVFVTEAPKEKAKTKKEATVEKTEVKEIAVEAPKTEEVVVETKAVEEVKEVEVKKETPAKKTATKRTTTNKGKK